jgi:hypothetical protein
VLLEFDRSIQLDELEDEGDNTDAAELELAAAVLLLPNTDGAAVDETEDIVDMMDPDASFLPLPKMMTDNGKQIMSVEGMRATTNLGFVGHVTCGRAMHDLGIGRIGDFKSAQFVQISALTCPISSVLI